MTDTICPGQLRSLVPDQDSLYMQNPQRNAFILVLQRHPRFGDRIVPIWEIYNVTSGHIVSAREDSILRNSVLVEVAQ